LFIWC